MWESIDIEGRSADVFTPADRPRFVLMFLADLDRVTLKGNTEWSSLLAANRMAGVCPDGGESWWADRIGPTIDPVRSAESYLLDVVIPAALSRLGLKVNAVALVGVGAGRQGALVYGFVYLDAFLI